MVHLIGGVQLPDGMGSGTQSTCWWFGCHYIMRQVVGLFLALRERASIAASHLRLGDAASHLRLGDAVPDRCGLQAARDFKLSTIEGLIQFISVTASTPGGCTVLCSRRDQR